MQFCHLLHMVSWRLYIIHCRLAVWTLKKWHLLTFIGAMYQKKVQKYSRIFIGTACIILVLSFICDMQFCHLLHLASWRLCIIHCRSVVRSNLKRWHLLAVISSNHQPCSCKRKLLRSTSVLTRFSDHVVIGTTCSSPSRERSFPNPAACRSLFATIDWPIDSALYKASPI